MLSRLETEACVLCDSRPSNPGLNSALATSQLTEVCRFIVWLRLQLAIITHPILYWLLQFMIVIINRQLQSGLIQLQQQVKLIDCSTAVRLEAGI